MRQPSLDEYDSLTDEQRERFHDELDRAIKERKLARIDGSAFDDE